MSSWWNWLQPTPAAAPPAVKPTKYNPADPAQNPLNPQGLKPCCACPDTKSARDQCFLNSGDQADEKCSELVAKHKACMAGFGFYV